MKTWLPNALAFQLVWLAAVGGAGRGWWWCGPLAVAVFAAWQLPASRWPRADALLMGVAAAVGFAVDTAWTRMGLMQFALPVPWATAAPVWIVALWMGFALTLNHSMAALKSRRWAAVALGAIGGPVAYLVAQDAWQAVTLSRPAWQPLAALAVAWGALTPALLALGTRLQARAPRAAPAH
jgi:hypothetical protein